MRISTAITFSVRAVFDMAYHDGDQPTQIKAICKRQKLPKPYLEQIFKKLLKAGLLKSKRGRGGGYMLSKNPSEITLMDLIDAAQGSIVSVACVDDRRRNCEVCHTCVAHHVWEETRNLLVNYFDSVTIADLCDSAREQNLPKD